MPLVAQVIAWIVLVITVLDSISFCFFPGDNQHDEKYRPANAVVAITIAALMAWLLFFARFAPS